jgi:hypothetical protein
MFIYGVSTSLCNSFLPGRTHSPGWRLKYPLDNNKASKFWSPTFFRWFGTLSDAQDTLYLVKNKEQTCSLAGVSVLYEDQRNEISTNVILYYAARRTHLRSKSLPRACKTNFTNTTVIRVLTPVPKQHPTQTDMPNSTNNQPVDDPSKDGDRGDILIRGMWNSQHETIVDIRVTDTDANAYKHQNPYDVLRKLEKEKKKKYLKACSDQHRSFVPFVVSTDGLLGREAIC